TLTGITLTGTARELYGLTPVILARCLLPPTSSTNTSSAEQPRVPITIAMGRAVAVPKAPTSGATVAPTAYCSTPSSADALPAMRGRSDNASAVGLGITKPRLETTTYSDGRMPTRPIPPVVTTESSATPPDA